jgi:primosomal protein N' (replication factor Y)
MYYYEIAPNQIVRTDNFWFTYSSKELLSVGQIVVIPVGKKYHTGVVLRKVKKPQYDTKEVASLIEENPLPEQMVSLAIWMSEYYGSHLATVLQTMLPGGLQKRRRTRTVSEYTPVRDRTKKLFTKDQSLAIETIDKAPAGSFLLHGITGSGKTEVYIELAKKAIKSGKSVIILVPEIALTTQLISEFATHFKNVMLNHSRQTEAERHLAWKQILNANEPYVAVGPRSTLFLPLRSLGLIVIDEAHESSYKQEQNPKYSAIRAASVLAKGHKAKLVLGSATPTVADYYLVKKLGSPIIMMTSSARKGVLKPSIELIDMKKRTNFRKHRFLSDKLLKEIETNVETGKQTLVFHNRRGTTTTTLCSNCGWTALDTETLTPLTLHADNHTMRSHVSGKTWPVPTSCPECGGTDIIHKGIGTKLIESELKKLFPNVSIERFDGDNSAESTVDKRYKEIYDGKVSIIIGTQVLAKGLDLPHLKTVGVIQADNGLSLPDYASSERTFQLLAQVIGRVGRTSDPTSVIVQSFQPDHPSIVHGVSQDYISFYEQTIEERRLAKFPPFSHLLKLTCTYKTEAAAIKNTKAFADIIKTTDPQLIVHGPAPAFYERTSNGYRWQLIVKSPTRKQLLEIVKLVPPKNWQSDIDPATIL